MVDSNYDEHPQREQIDEVSRAEAARAEAFHRLSQDATASAVSNSIRLRLAAKEQAADTSATDTETKAYVGHTSLREINL